MFDREALIALVREKSLKFGDFTLSSGKKASYYLDGKQITLDSVGAALIGDAILDLLSEQMPDAVGGMSVGADPITAAVITVAGQRDISLKGFLVRKEAKGHGTNRYVEGPVQDGDEAIVLEDVVTTGAASLTAIERAEEFGLVVRGVVAIVDRLEGGGDAIRQRGYDFSSLLTVRDFGIEPAAC